LSNTHINRKKLQISKRKEYFIYTNKSIVIVKIATTEIQKIIIIIINIYYNVNKIITNKP